VPTHFSGTTICGKDVRGCHRERLPKLCNLVNACSLHRTINRICSSGAQSTKHVTITRAKRICTSITGTCLLVSCILFTGIPKNVFYFVLLPLLVLISCQVLIVLPAVGFYGLKRRERKVSVVKKNEQCLSPTFDNEKEKAKRNVQVYRFLFETRIFTICAVLILVFSSIVLISISYCSCESYCNCLENSGI